MLRIVLGNGLILMSQHLLRRGDTYYYWRKIPKDLQERFGGQKLKRVSLGTGDKLVAAKKASAMAAADDALWSAMRGKSDLSPPEVRAAAKALLDEVKPSEWIETGPNGEKAVWSRQAVLAELLEGDDRLGSSVHLEANNLLSGAKVVPLLSEAMEVYLSEHKNGRQPKFSRDTSLAVELVIKSIGDRPLDSYSRREVAEWRDKLLAYLLTL